MQMKMNVGLSGPVTSVAAGGVHVCDAAEAVRLFRAGYGIPTADSKDEFAAALAEWEALEVAEAEAAVAQTNADADAMTVETGNADGEGALQEPTQQSEQPVQPAKAEKPARGKKVA